MNGRAVAGNRPLNREPSRVELSERGVGVCVLDWD